jgi:hypothetical protein
MGRECMKRSWWWSKKEKVFLLFTKHLQKTSI